MDSPTIASLLQLLFSLSIAVPGAAALVAVLISIGKMFGLVKDGQAKVFVNILNVLFAIVIGVLAQWFPTLVDFANFDAFLQSLSGTLTAFLPLLAILVKWLTPLIYGALRGFPVLGYTYKK